MGAGRLRSELRPSRLIPGLTAGILAGAIEIVIAVSFAALIFTGPLERHLPAGIGLALLGGLVTLRRSLETMELDDPLLAAALHRMFARSLAARLTDTLQTIDAFLD
jgi:hypothetical protein